MRQVTREVYTYAELSPEARERALARHNQLEAECGDNNQRITDMFREDLTQLGLDTLRCEWDLSHTQGSGVAFYGRIETCAVPHIPGLADLFARAAELDAFPRRGYHVRYRTGMHIPSLPPLRHNGRVHLPR